VSPSTSTPACRPSSPSNSSSRPRILINKPRNWIGVASTQPTGHKYAWWSGGLVVSITSGSDFLADDSRAPDRRRCPEALPRNPASELTFTMEPRQAASIVGNTARVSLNEPVRLIPRTRSQMASDVSWAPEAGLVRERVCSRRTRPFPAGSEEAAAPWVLQPGSDCVLAVSGVDFVAIRPQSLVAVVRDRASRCAPVVRPDQHRRRHEATTRWSHLSCGGRGSCCPPALPR
jgi:hypothetical protein